MAISSGPIYRADIITEAQAKGLGNFVSKFALPALLFKNMVLLDFGDVIWAFLWSVLVAKVCACVCGHTSHSVFVEFTLESICSRESKQNTLIWMHPSTA